MRRVPTQTAEIEPDKDVLEHVKRLYREGNSDLEPEEFVRRMVIDSTRLEVDLDGVDWEP